MQYTHKYSSPLGAITTASDGQNLTGLWFDGQKYFGRTLEKEHEEKFLSVFECTDAWLDMYFSGKKPDFTPPLSLSGSPFRQRVWEILLAIPYGKTTTYGAIAAQIAAGNGTFAYVRTSGRRRRGAQSDIRHRTCHRVLGSDGSLTGYAGGTDKKIRLLQLEGVRI